MPTRETPLVTDYYYHVYNRCPHGLSPFSDKRSAIEMVKAIMYYTQLKPPIRLSLRDKLPKKQLQDNFESRLVDILTYCVMPNHFHLLVQQKVDGGISTYLRRLQNSITRYYNEQTHSVGSLFQGPFKAALIESESHLLHVSRYIHLNPTSAKLVRDPLDYPYSSLLSYAHNKFSPPLVPDSLLRNSETAESYLNFVKDNVLYQAELQAIKRSLLDEEL